MDRERMREHRLVERGLHRDVKVLLKALDGLGVARCQLFATIDPPASEAEGKVPDDQEWYLEVPRWAFQLTSG